MRKRHLISKKKINTREGITTCQGPKSEFFLKNYLLSFKKKTVVNVEHVDK